VRTIFDLAGRLSAARLGGALHSRVSVTVKSLEQSEWGSFERQVFDHGALLGVELAPYPAQVIYYLPHDLTTAIIDLRLAGPGRKSYPERPLTDLERRVLSRPTEALCVALAEAVGSVVPSVGLGSINHVTGLQSLQLTDARQQCVVAGFAAHFAGGVEYSFACCAPVATLRPLIETIEARGTRREDRERAYSTEIERLAREIPTRLTLAFDEIEASLGTLEALSVGSVLSLEHPVDEPLLLMSGGVALYRANRVLKGRRLAAQITERLDPDGHPGDLATPNHETTAEDNDKER